MERIHSWPLWKKTSYNTQGGVHKNGGTPLRGNYAGIGYTWDEDNNIFWPKKPYASWVKDTTTASWKSPIGDAPALTAEQTSQNEAGTHSWNYDSTVCFYLYCLSIPFPVAHETTKVHYHTSDSLEETQKNNIRVRTQFV